MFYSPPPPPPPCTCLVGVPLDEEFVHISLGLFVIYTVLAFVGVVSAVACLVLNLYFKNKKCVLVLDDTTHNSPHFSRVVVPAPHGHHPNFF